VETINTVHKDEDPLPFFRNPSNRSASGTTIEQEIKRLYPNGGLMEKIFQKE
jgi:hypothetical protein